VGCSKAADKVEMIPQYSKASKHGSYTKNAITIQHKNLAHIVQVHTSYSLECTVTVNYFLYKIQTF